MVPSEKDCSRCMYWVGEIELIRRRECRTDLSCTKRRRSNSAGKNQSGPGARRLGSRRPGGREPAAGEHGLYQ
jgi:hypothetical protein